VENGPRLPAELCPGARSPSRTPGIGLAVSIGRRVGATVHEVPAEDSWIREIQGPADESAKTLAACLKFDAEVDRIGERLGAYAFLRTAEDQANSAYQRMLGRFQTVATQAGRLASFIRPEYWLFPRNGWRNCSPPRN
jgi:hypothetical protein